MNDRDTSRCSESAATCRRIRIYAVGGGTGSSECSEQSDRGFIDVVVTGYSPMLLNFLNPKFP